MDKLKLFILKHPNRFKYGFAIIDMFLVLIAIKIFINYNNIEVAITETAQQSQDKTMELGYAQNFQLPYEKSEYAQRFLKHENNMLLPGEFIIKFQDKASMVNTGSTGGDQKGVMKLLTSPQQARQQFLKEKLFPPSSQDQTQ